MNLNLFGHDGRWLMVDCGVTFEETLDGNEVQMADPQFILDRVESWWGLWPPMPTWTTSAPCRI
jgi:ribonuclease J